MLSRLKPTPPVCRLRLDGTNATFLIRVKFVGPQSGKRLVSQGTPLPVAAQLRCKASARRKTLLAAVRAKTRRQPSGILLAELAKKDRPRPAKPVLWRQTPVGLGRLREPTIKAPRQKDPKGALTVEFLKKADKPELAKSVLEHSSVMPEEVLVQKIQTGELDVGFFYSVETTGAGLTAIDLPAGIMPKAIYTVTILQNVLDPDGAQKFVSFLLGSKGSALLKEHGLSLTHPQLWGADSSVPPAIRSLVAK
jgi:Bacterial extracellular solute-binding protein